MLALESQGVFNLSQLASRSLRHSTAMLETVFRCERVQGYGNLMAERLHTCENFDQAREWAAPHMAAGRFQPDTLLRLRVLEWQAAAFLKSRADKAAERQKVLDKQAAKAAKVTKISRPRKVKA